MSCSYCANNISHLIIMWWQLVEELLDSELLSRTVHIGDLVLRQTGEIQLHLKTNHCIEHINGSDMFLFPTYKVRAKETHDPSIG